MVLTQISGLINVLLPSSIAKHHNMLLFFFLQLTYNILLVLGIQNNGLISVFTVMSCFKKLACSNHGLCAKMLLHFSVFKLTDFQPEHYLNQ